ncbi:MAG: hypothetical protein EOR30_32095 [Mesorhizobium sp.]|uniref:endonuclease/exonuclease/phosphatase family protein n=1 Tax=Mesorhizobium sp. TaxID=1871066 RepID=UPI000FE92F10|nr:endonuclease/exonuclease/phosphatase family protein [Mesorhizobium sp.]RWI33299.1 MAG: hypothetical protein EOR14_33175 [Mesorhizobium sp.]RWI37071.1 MAG: hypothetical protein EOR14_26020 [Mesorhizobium sp.]RWI62625.1 MAG: hypothetical protein EOR17_32080 [Mesorhizobium sp.]RWI81448.1 MAG: hypothetical protein EOR20_32495 [Mesorhizobium sp.]RWJ42393.1 MAG: hypothetical protein EOR30_32095 [Mesorhizobium sp.]
MNKVLSALLVAISTLALPASATELKLGNWNVQTLLYAGDPVTVFPGDYIRQPQDYADLQAWRDKVGASVFFLQEVSSPAAINEVFPIADGWAYCISGQFAADEGSATPGPICTKAGDTPVKPAGSERHQYTAVAWRADAGVTATAADVPQLNVKSDDGGTIRDVRWGLDVTVTAGATSVRALVVHMKSGCFDDLINFRLFTVDPSTTPPTRNACDTLGRQMFPLRAWVEARQNAGDAWMVVGDFNRRLDAGAGRFQDEVWQAVSGYSPAADLHDRDNRPDIALFRAPYKEPSLCWADTSNPYPTSLPTADDYNMLPIEFFVFGAKVRDLAVANSGGQVPWTPSVAADHQRLSDHCPSTLSINVQ